MVIVEKARKVHISCQKVHKKVKNVQFLAVGIKKICIFAS